MIYEATTITSVILSIILCVRTISRNDDKGKGNKAQELERNINFFTTIFYSAIFFCCDFPIAISLRDILLVFFPILTIIIGYVKTQYTLMPTIIIFSISIAVMGASDAFPNMYVCGHMYFMLIKLFSLFYSFNKPGNSIIVKIESDIMYQISLIISIIVIGAYDLILLYYYDISLRLEQKLMIVLYLASIFQLSSSKKREIPTKLTIIKKTWDPLFLKMILMYLIVANAMILYSRDYSGLLINIQIFVITTVFTQLRIAKKKTSLNYLQIIFYPERIEIEGDKYSINHFNKAAELVYKGNTHNFIRSSIIFDDTVYKVEYLRKKCLKKYHLDDLILQTDYRSNEQYYGLRRVIIDYLPQNTDSFNFLGHLITTASVELTERCRNVIKNEGIIYSIKDTKIFYCPKNKYHLTIRESFTSIGSNAFISCVKLRFLYFPPSVQRIGDQAFSNCIRLKRIRFHEQSHLISIGANAFSCTALENINFPRSLQTIASSAFNPCPLLRRVTFPKDSNLLSCESDVFHKQNELKIVFPKHFLLFPAISMKQ